MNLGAPWSRRGWQPSEDALLRSLWASGATVPEIAERLPGKTTAAVFARLHRLGLRAETALGHVDRLWLRGFTPAETRLSLRRHFGQDWHLETIRDRFAELSHKPEKRP